MSFACWKFDNKPVIKCNWAIQSKCKLFLNLYLFESGRCMYLCIVQREKKIEERNTTKSWPILSTYNTTFCELCDSKLNGATNRLYKFELLTVTISVGRTFSKRPTWKWERMENENEKEEINAKTQGNYS